ncbi:MAG: hypothetical protein WAO58_13615 [Fimbriimonadaceae bacterium]
MSGRAWDAKWIGYAYDPREDLGVFAFRRRLDLASVPSELRINVSADQRYKLLVNGEQVIFGPQRGDPNHWFFETVDLAPFLVKGTNWIVAVVWNFGWMSPMAQMSAGRTAFVLEDLSEPTASTPDSWEVMKIEGWGFDMMHRGVGEFYIDVGPGEIIDARAIPWGFLTGERSPRSPGSEMPLWQPPHVICRAEERGAGGGGTPWMLIPRSIPPMEYLLREAPPQLRKDFDPSAEPAERKMPVGEQTAPVLEGRWEVPKADSPSPAPGERGLGGEVPLAFPFSLESGSPILLDYEEIICAFPRLTLSGPPGTVVTLTYDEALWNPDGTKGNRDEVAGKHARGYQDKFILDGSTRTFEPLWWRTWRYLLIEIDRPAGRADLQPGEPTQIQSGSKLPHSIQIHSISAHETGYPLREESSFRADDPWVKPIWDVSLRTARRCAGETYFDCPYYEQLQYIGDTRIQALIGYYLGRDRALQRNAVETLGWSLMENGLTQSRYPSRQTQIIPPFSLWWVMMMYDQMMYDVVEREPLAIRPFHLAERVLDGMHSLYEKPEFWTFVDWVPDWRWGVPREHARGAIESTMRLLADAAKDRMGFSEGDNHAWPARLIDRDYAGSFADVNTNWQELLDSMEEHASQQNLLLADATATSEHVEAIGRQLPAMIGRDPIPWPAEALSAVSAAKCTYYFSYYKHLAMFGRPAAEAADRTDTTDKTDMSNLSHRSYPHDYLQELQPWKEMIESGLTTFAENPEPTRSDCHAWSAHPILGFFQIVAGVTSIAPGWKKAKIMPHPGSLRRFNARIAHPDGELRVAYEDGKLFINSPVPFQLAWDGKSASLAPGTHKL